MVVVAAILGAALALGVFQWEEASRAAGATVPTAVAAADRPSVPSPQAVGASTVPAGAASSPELQAGAKVFADKCNSCHPGAKAGVGPALYGPEFGARFPEDGPVKLVIRQGRGVMPAFALAQVGDSDLDAVVAYLRSLKSAPASQPTPTPTVQVVGAATVFAARCDICHPGAKAGIGPAIYGSALNGKYPDDAALMQAIRQSHGNHPAFPPEKLSDEDLNGLISYLHSLK
jgi:mono/diheme cytochrome c family protein